jgi:hypothetical protein
MINCLSGVAPDIRNINLAPIKGKHLPEAISIKLPGQIQNPFADDGAQ